MFFDSLQPLQHFVKYSGCRRGKLVAVPHFSRCCRVAVPCVSFCNRGPDEAQGKDIASSDLWQEKKITISFASVPRNAWAQRKRLLGKEFLLLLGAWVILRMESTLRSERENQVGEAVPLAWREAECVSVWGINTATMAHFKLRKGCHEITLMATVISGQERQETSLRRTLRGLWRACRKCEMAQYVLIAYVQSQTVKRQSETRLEKRQVGSDLRTLHEVDLYPMVPVPWSLSFQPGKRKPPRGFKQDQTLESGEQEWQQRSCVVELQDPQMTVWLGRMEQQGDTWDAVQHDHPLP